MPKETWIVGIVLTILVIAGIAGLSGRNRARVTEVLASRVVQLTSELETTSNRVAGVEAELAEAKTRLENLAAEKEEATQSQQTLESEMKARLESKDITISELQGRLTVNIVERVLFDSGEAELKPEGGTVLLQVGAVLNSYTNRHIHVMGHTDNMPIRATAASRHASNWELSAARALAAVRFLQEKATVDPRRLAAVGCGEHRPIADNSTAEGRFKNRRISIVVLSSELVTGD